MRTEFTLDAIPLSRTDLEAAFELEVRRVVVVVHRRTHDIDEPARFHVDAAVLARNRPYVHAPLGETLAYLGRLPAGDNEGDDAARRRALLRELDTGKLHESLAEG